MGVSELQAKEYSMVFGAGVEWKELTLLRQYWVNFGEQLKKEMRAMGREDKCAVIDETIAAIKEGTCKHYYYWRKKHKISYHVGVNVVAPVKQAEKLDAMFDWATERYARGEAIADGWENTFEGKG